ncbi:protein phosphatase [Streptomyces radicis]|uniref:Protein phosphatase n=1 Tax=Streptomyces radicis TaxID=1750517 RepID=A0A3A9WBR0_9ACTN|nr:protein phosphatase [Streptomyces radicis]RKN24694.1 protein phosphatase [Streptomyces radicis]
MPGSGLVVLVLGVDGEVLATTPGTEGLTGRPPSRLHGRPLDEVVHAPAPWQTLAGRSDSLTAELTRPDGRTTRVRLDVLAVPDGEGARHVVMMAAESAARREDEDDAVVRSLFAQANIGMVIHDAELRVTRLNMPPGAFLPQGEPTVDRPLPQPLDELLVPEDAHAIVERLRDVAASGEPQVNYEQSARLKRTPDRERVLSLSSLPLDGGRGQLIGVVSVFADVTEQHRSRRRVALLHSAAQRIGVSLDVARDADELARVLVPDFADLVAVDLAEAVLEGDEPGQVTFGVPMRRVAGVSARGRWPDEVIPVGASFRVEHARGIGRYERPATLEPRREDLWVRTTGGASAIAVEGRSLVPPEPGSLMVVSLRARGLALGVVALWRYSRSGPFEREDADTAEEVGSRASLGLDNARRYLRERRTVETLQRNLLPQPVFDLKAAQTSGSYLPAGTAAGLGGTWYDVIPLSSARVAFVVGDVAGHGLAATATMGRLRTAVQTLADLDLAPDELLTRLDDLAIRLADAEPPVEGNAGAVGATCLYCVYDPVTGECEMAAAGRQPPMIVVPGERPEPAPLKPGPVLGVGAAPFELARLRLAPGSTLVMFSDELVAEPTGEPRQGAPAETSEQRLERLRDVLAAHCGAKSSPAEIGQAMLDALQPARSPANDVALLVARVQALPDGMVASWEYPADPAVVGEARVAVTRRLTEWGLAANAFPTELIVSELVTNAIRWAGGPVGLRLIRDETLIVEVSDPSETQPHLRSPRSTDEGGRGLFLVAQLAHRWGSRYTPSGKTIWTEQPLEGE